VEGKKRGEGTRRPMETKFETPVEVEEEKKRIGTNRPT
jgi:hypothetical protein